MEINVHNMDGEIVDKIDVSDDIFGITPNIPVVHQAAVLQLANRRHGTSATKTRGMVSGGGAKPFKQKGTGHARQGSKRAPHFKGGGVAFGPHPRDYRLVLPRKMRRLAVRSALSAKAADERIVLLDTIEFAAPRTKDMINVLRALPVNRKVLVLLTGSENNVVKSARNIEGVKTLSADSVNVVDILNHDYLIAPVSAVRRVEALLSPRGESVEPTEAR